MTFAARGVVLLALCVSGCAASSSPAPAPRAGSVRAETPGKQGPQTRPGLALARGTVGPFLSVGDGATVLLWAKPQDPKSGWWTIAADRSGSPIGEPKKIAEAPGRVNLVRLSSIQDSQALALVTGAGQEGAALWSLTLGDAGELRGGPSKLAGLPNGALWIDSVAVKDGYLAFWAERGTAEAQIMAVRLNASGQPLSDFARLHSAATAWQIQPIPDGAVLALVTGEGEVEALSIDAEAEVSSRFPIAGSAGAGQDLDLARVGDQLVLSFSQPRPIERHLVQVSLSLDGRPQTDLKTLVAPRGEQRLVRLVGGEVGYVAWQEPDVSPATLVAPLSNPNAALRLRLDERAGAAEFAASRSGLNVLFWSCPLSAGCEEPVLPTLLRTDSAGSATSLSAWPTKAGAPPNLSWDLRCDGDDCKALVANFASRAEVQIRKHEPGRWALPIDDSPPPPRTRQALIATNELADLEVAQFAGGALLTWLTKFDPSTPYVRRKTPAPDGRLAPVRAKLFSSWLPKGSSQATEPQVLSYRARSIAGIGLSPRKRNTLLAWTAIDGREPQVFTTLLNRQGTRIKQRMLTRQKGEPSELSAAPLADGWAVSWCNTVGTKTSAYVAKIGPDLRRISQDTNLGLSRHVQTAALDGRIWTLRTDPGQGVMLGARHASTLKSVGAEKILSPSVDAELVRLVASNGQLLAAWVEGGQVPKLRWARIQDGNSSNAPEELALTSAPTELRIACKDSSCYAALATEDERILRVALEPGGKTRELSGLAPPALPLPVGKEVWFHSSTRSGQLAIHRATF